MPLLWVQHDLDNRTLPPDIANPAAPGSDIQESLALAKVAFQPSSIAAEPIVLRDGRAVEVTVSAGLASWRTGKLIREDSLARTYEAADGLLYEAKRTGRAKLVSDWQLAA